jgi:hypothetical protein
MKILIVMAAALLPAVAAQAADSNFRCGKWVVSRDMDVSELRAKCGEPVSRETRVEDVMARNQNTGLMYKTGVTQTEIWTYDRGSTAPSMIVTIVDGRIKSIERSQ